MLFCNSKFRSYDTSTNFSNVKKHKKRGPDFTLTLAKK